MAGIRKPRTYETIVAMDFCGVGCISNIYTVSEYRKKLKHHILKYDLKLTNE